MTKSSLAKLAIIVLLASSTAAVARGGGAGGASSGSTSGIGHEAGPMSSPAPGINSAGTAQSSGVAGNMEPGVTTGQASSSDQDRSVDAAIANENREADSKLHGICRGC